MGNWQSVNQTVESGSTTGLRKVNYVSIGAKKQMETHAIFPPTICSILTMT